MNMTMPRPTPKKKLPAYKIYNRTRLRAVFMTWQRAEALLSTDNTDAAIDDTLARCLAHRLMNRPRKIPRLQPSGRFHRKVLDYILAHPRMTPALRSMLAQHNHLLGYLL